MVPDELETPSRSAAEDPLAVAFLWGLVPSFVIQIVHVCTSEYGLHQPSPILSFADRIGVSSLEDSADSVRPAAPDYISGLPSAALLRMLAPGPPTSLVISNSAILTFRIMPADSGFRPLRGSQKERQRTRRSPPGGGGGTTSTISERLGYGSWAIATMSRSSRRSDWILCVAAAAGGDIFQHNAPETLVARCDRRASHGLAQMPRGGCLRARGRTYVRSC